MCFENLPVGDRTIGTPQVRGFDMRWCLLSDDVFIDFNAQSGAIGYDIDRPIYLHLSGENFRVMEPELFN